MRLEFLQADEDIVEFVAYLYEQGYALTRGCRQMRDIVMDPVTAVYELRHDLHRGGVGSTILWTLPEPGFWRWIPAAPIPTPASWEGRAAAPV